MENIAIKTCFRCGQLKPLADFYVHKQMKEGVLGKCKECTRRDVKEHRKKNVERIREYDRWRGRTEKRKSRVREYHKTKYRERARAVKAAWAKRNPEKRKAQQKVANALKSGRLKKTPCETCGKEKVEAHHPDYTKPFHIIWLCRSCHAELHRQYPVFPF